MGPWPSPCERWLPCVLNMNSLYLSIVFILFFISSPEKGNVRCCLKKVACHLRGFVLLYICLWFFVCDLFLFNLVLFRTNSVNFIFINHSLVLGNVIVSNELLCINYARAWSEVFFFLFCKCQRFDPKSMNYCLPEIDEVIFWMPSSLPGKTVLFFHTFSYYLRGCNCLQLGMRESSALPKC